jgi:hypothetical protein
VAGTGRRRAPTGRCSRRPSGYRTRRSSGSAPELLEQVLTTSRRGDPGGLIAAGYSKTLELQAAPTWNEPNPTQRHVGGRTDARGLIGPFGRRSRHDRKRSNTSKTPSRTIVPQG